MSAGGELARLGLVAARRAIASGELCPVEYADALLSRIEALDHEVHSFVLVDAERARERARRLRDGRARTTVSGGALPPLFGVPYAVKDIVDVAGLPTTAQSRVMPATPAGRSAAVIRRLDLAGAVLLGKLTLYEFAIGGPTFDLPWPPARNPWNLEYTAGSSSSGSGAALAAGFVPLTIGTDTGGSIRSPAAMNGVVGLKPTHGAVSTDGVFPLAPSLDTVGPLARSVEDVAVAFAALVGTSPGYLASCDGLEGTRVGVVRHFHETDLAPSDDVLQAVDAHLDEIRSRGAVVEDVRLSPLDRFNAAGWVSLLSESHEIHGPWLRGHPERYGRHALEVLLGGAFITPEDHLRARRLRARLAAEVDRALDAVDVLVMAVSALPPCPIDDREALARLASASIRMPANATGHPALSIPSGLSHAGLPIGIQVLGRKGGEQDLLRLGGAMARSAHRDGGASPFLRRPTASSMPRSPPCWT